MLTKKVWLSWGINSNSANSAKVLIRKEDYRDALASARHNCRNRMFEEIVEWPQVCESHRTFHKTHDTRDIYSSWWMSTPTSLGDLESIVQLHLPLCWMWAWTHTPSHATKKLIRHSWLLLHCPTHFTSASIIWILAVLEIMLAFEYQELNKRLAAHGREGLNEALIKGKDVTILLQHFMLASLTWNSPGLGDDGLPIFDLCWLGRRSRARNLVSLLFFVLLCWS